MKVSASKSLLIFWAVYLFWNSLSAQEFIEWTSIVLPQVYNSSAAWGDYDNDGDLDILITGNTDTTRISKIYKNLGFDIFAEQTGISLTGVDNGSVAWGDYDNDGDLDILLTGDTGSEFISKIYKNNGNNTFTEQTGITLTGVRYSSVAWGDADNDGDLDILLTGNNLDSNTKIYKNNGDNSFTEQTQISLTDVYSSSVDWGDYDNDGDLDILLTGWYKVAKIYMNYGDFIFVEQTGISLLGVNDGSAAWGDYDNDGDLDILLVGDPGSGWSSDYSIVYENNGNNTFTEQTQISLTGVNACSIAWGDYNNDGDLDILLTGGWRSGVYSLGVIVKLYENDGDKTFTELTGLPLTAVNDGSVAWGDYDNDGDLDLLLTGRADDPESDTPVSKIYKNNSSVSNTIPDAPTGLSSTTAFHPVTDNSINNLSWNKAFDNETPQDGLTYNAYIYQKNGDTLWSSMADIASGYRKIPALGNAQQDTSWTIYNLEAGKYHWSVQAIDHAFAGSHFAVEDSFSISGSISPPVSSNQTVCYGEQVPELTATGENIKWYSDADLLVLVHSGSSFSTGQTDQGVYTYYVTQTVNIVESEATIVTLTIHDTPQATITDSTKILCFGLEEGTATITPSGGTLPYTYQWDDDSNTTDSTATDLQANKYYHAIVTDANTCSATDSVILSEPVLLSTEITDWTNVTDIGESDGSATVTPSGGTAPYSYSWDDDLSTTDSTVTGLSANKWYHVVVTDEYSCLATDSIILVKSGVLYAEITDSTNISCNGLDDGSATVTIWGGAIPYSILWNDDAGSTTPTASDLSQERWYTVTVTDASMQTVKDSVFISEPYPINVSKTFSRISCPGVSNGYIDLSVSGGSSPYSFVWSTSDITEDINNLNPGVYSVVITDNNDCIVHDTTAIDSSITYQDQEICMVTVNNANRILVVWEKTYNQGIASFNIYREQFSKDNYVKIATVPFDSLSVYVDAASVPEENPHFYKISVTDSCGNESDLSPLHKSIHLNTNMGMNNEVNLNWDEYEGFDYYEYEIFRGKSLSELYSIRTISASIRSWSDKSAPSGKNYYRILVVKPTPCLPTDYKSNEYSSLFSNYDERTIVGNKQFEVSGFNIYPNPFYRSTTITFPNSNGESFSLVLTDLSGKVCRMVKGIKTSEYVLEKGDLKAGLYFIELRGPEFYRGKVVIE